MDFSIVNIDRYLGLNCGEIVLRAYRTVKKFYRRFQLILLDIKFLKTCRADDIIPRFLWFKTANDDLTGSSIYKNCQRRFLNLQIDLKYRDLRRAKKDYLWSLDILKNCTTDDLFQHLQDVIVYISIPLLQKKQDKLDGKLCGYDQHILPKNTIKRKVVRNLSSRILSNDEIDCLANGIEFGLLPRRVDDMGAISNIEFFFHQVTVIYQKHKSLMSELEEKDKAGGELRILTAQEMTLASNLRSITDSFRFQANRFCQTRYRNNPEQEQYRSLLKHLKEDKSIVITRPDKGRGVVLMNKNEYLSKMYAIVNDLSKFKRLSTDPTIAREQNLINLLNRLLKEKSITEQFFKISCPKDSNPGLLYGLPKVHKDNIPLRPVLSALGTFNYGLGKALTNMLSDIIETKNMVRDPFSFVKELRTLPTSFCDCKMVSFDISSLYTNVPLDETIEIILKNLYETRTTPPTIKREDMKQLLIFATKNSHFLFDGQLYDQIDGVSMGSPLAPLLAEIFLQDLEKKHSSSFTSLGIVYWKRYVDDTFVLIDSTFSAKDICTKLSQFHKSIKFTSEEEATTTHTLSFLNILIQKLPGVGFATKIYRKETFSGLITKWSSFVPKTYKYNAISTLVYRAIKICSSYKNLHQEFRFIRKLATKNGYPINFVNSIIRRQLDLEYNPPAPKPSTLNTDTVVVRVPYFGLPSQVYAKRITSAVSKQYPLKKIRIVYDVKDRIGSGFTTKDKIPKLIKSGVVYEAQCSKCSDSYIGKTYRHLKTRINEHLAEQKKSSPPAHKKTQPVIKRNQSSSQPHTKTKTHMTRSKTGKLPPPIYDLSKDHLKDLFKNIVLVDKKGNTTTPKSSIAKHYYSTGHVFTSDNFKILLTEKQKYRLLVKESLLIRKRQPPLNNTDRSVPLYVYPGGLNIMKRTQHNRRIAIHSSRTQ